MRRYVLKRLGQTILTVFLTVTVVFVLLRLAPGDPAATTRRRTRPPSSSRRSGAQFGLDQPLLEQYWTFLKDLFQGDVGHVVQFQAPALDRGPGTAALHDHPGRGGDRRHCGAWRSRSACGWPGGPTPRRELGRQHRDHRRPVDAGLLDRLRAAHRLRRVDPGGSRPPGFTTWAGLVLPTLTIAILQVALISRLVRREMVGNLAAPYLTVARSRGVSRTRADLALRHAPTPRSGGHRPGHPVRRDAQRRRHRRGGLPLARRRLAGRRRPRDPRLPLIQATVLVTVVLALSSSCSSTCSTRCWTRGSASERPAA